MGDKARGLYSKYLVYKVEDEEQKLANLVTEPCFVLKPNSDPHARAALQSYAESAAADGYEALAEDLFNWLGSLP